MTLAASLHIDLSSDNPGELLSFGMGLVARDSMAHNPDTGWYSASIDITDQDEVRRWVVAAINTQILGAERPSPLDPLRKAIQTDPDYAWTWHCNLAMAFYDELLPGVELRGGPHEESERKDARKMANQAAARFMKQAFGVEPKEPGT